MVKYLASLLNWVDERFPLSKMWNEHIAQYYAPKNFNFWYFFGSLAIVVLAGQLLTGVWLTMYYKPDATLAFDSVEYIMRDVNWGWLIRYLHSTGASAFFFVIYMHMFRGLLYGSYKKPRELLWLLGMALFLLLMGEAFTGYLLPWGQLSYWGAQVIISLFSAIPWFGEDLAQWIRGDFVISDATLNRFFAFHVIALPLMLVILVYLHIVALHHVGSNNPDGIEIKKNKNAQGIPLDGIPFHPYYTVKDLLGTAVFALIFAWVVFYAPEMGGLFLEYANFTPANPVATPEHIAPVWYFTPFYSILRAVPNKLGGVIAMFSAVILPFLLPWLDRCPIRSIRYRSACYKVALGLFTVSFLILGYLGTQPVTPVATAFAQAFSLVYFVFFLAMPIYTRWEKGLPEPERLTPIIPLLERQEPHWRLLRWLLDEIQAHPKYREATAKVVELVGKIRNKLPPFGGAQDRRFPK